MFRFRRKKTITQIDPQITGTGQSGISGYSGFSGYINWVVDATYYEVDLFNMQYEDMKNILIGYRMVPIQGWIVRIPNGEDPLRDDLVEKGILIEVIREKAGSDFLNSPPRVRNFSLGPTLKERMGLK